MSDQNVEIARRMLDAFGRRDINSVLESMDPEVSFFAPTAVYADRSNHLYRGHDGIREYFEDVERVWEELRLGPEEYRESEDSVVAIGTVKGLLKNGDSFESVAGWAWRFREGKIVWCRVYTDPSDARLRLTGDAVVVDAAATGSRLKIGVAPSSGHASWPRVPIQMSFRDPSSFSIRVI